MGPMSDFWQSFIEPYTQMAYYTISIGRSNGTTTGEGASSAAKSNISLGSPVDSSYDYTTNLAVNSYSNYSYALSDFSFGIIYSTDGSATE